MIQVWLLTPPHFSLHLQDVLRGAADEVLGVLKNKDMRDPDRQKGCEVNGHAYGRLPGGVPSIAWLLFWWHHTTPSHRRTLLPSVHF